MQSDSQMLYHNLFFFKDLNMKTLLKMNINMTRQYLKPLNYPLESAALPNLVRLSL